MWVICSSTGSRHLKQSYALGGDAHLCLLCELEGIFFNTQGYSNMVKKLNFKREKIIDIQKALKSADVNQDNKLDFEEWRANLKS